jgi:hypothetical protein
VAAKRQGLCQLSTGGWRLCAPRGSLECNVSLLELPCFVKRLACLEVEVSQRVRGVGTRRNRLVGLLDVAARGKHEASV